MVSLVTDFRNPRLFLFCFCCFFFAFEGFGLVPPLCIYVPPFFNKVLRLAVDDGGFPGCQPSWDVSVSS